MLNVLLIGALDFPNVPMAGDAVKNRLLLDWFRQNFRKVGYVDTQKWRKNPFVLMKLFFCLLFCRIGNIIVSASNESAYRMIRILAKLDKRKTKVYYFMIGGYTPIKIRQGIFKAEPFRKLERIVVEADKVKDYYAEVGLYNTYRVYNFKSTSYRADVSRPHEGRFKFVFLSRLTELKGIFHILESVRTLNEEGWEDGFEVDFYGRMDEDVKERFVREIERCNRNKCHLIVLVEHGGKIKSLADVINWKNPRLRESPYAVSGERLFKIMTAMANYYGIEWQFCSKQNTGKRIIELLGGETDER